MGKYSTTLFARPSFLGGAASIIDLGGTLVEYNRSDTPEEADAECILLDITAVHEAMIMALSDWRAEYQAAAEA